MEFLTLKVRCPISKNQGPSSGVKGSNHDCFNFSFGENFNNIPFKPMY